MCPVRRATRGERTAHCLALCLVAALLLGQALLPWAWDRDRMLAAALKRGPLAVAATRALQVEMAAVQGGPDTARLEAMNRFFNLRIAYAEDIDATGQVDQWASPIETLAGGSGDCEDYAIAKYFSLIASGVAPPKLRLVYVRADMGGGSRAHMVLAYYPQPSAEPLILDNLDGRILPASARRDLNPVFSFNAEGLWEGSQGRAAGDSVARLSRWREVLAKARAEGFV